MENADNALILLYDLCRLCLDEPGVENIFEPSDWSEDILFYTGIKVTISDKLPQTICRSCRDIMTCVKVLKDIATANETRLREISGFADANQVLVSESPSHLIFITPRTNDQNDLNDDPVISSGSVQKLINRLVFESDDEISQTEKQSKKKESLPSSSTSERTNSAPKVISIRKDLFDSSAIVTSTKKRQESPSSTSNSPKDNDDSRKASSSSSRKRSKQSPTSTSSNEPTKIVKVSSTALKVHKYEFECETCKKTYATHKKLYLHQFAHNKKFQCPLDVCYKKFATKGDLQKHIRSHTGEKPYKCNFCDLSFTQNVTLRAHKEKIHNEPLSQSFS